MSASGRCWRMSLCEGASTLKSFYPQAFMDIGDTFGLTVRAIGVFGFQMNNGGKCTMAIKAIGRLVGFRGCHARTDVSDALGVGSFILEVR